MTSERRDDTIRACRCCFMCRYASPHFRASRLESRTPKGFAILLDAVDHGARAWTPELAAVFYESTLGGEGRAECEFDWPEDELARQARAEIVRAGVAPAVVRALRDNLVEHGSPADTTLPEARLPEPHVDRTGAELLYLAGNETRALLPEAVTAAASLLSAVGADWATPSREPATGAHLWDLGYQDDAVGQAKAFAEAVAKSGAREVVMSSTAELRAVRQWFGRWNVELPEGVTFVHVSEYLAGKLDSLRFARESEAVGYHDCAWLGRALHVYDAPRALLAAANDTQPLELPAARTAAHSSGAGTSLYLTHGGLAARIARMLVEEAEEVGISTLVTANPVDAVHLSRVADGMGSRPRVLELATFVANRLKGDS